jgi:hypothetical protein
LEESHPQRVRTVEDNVNKQEYSQRRATSQLALSHDPQNSYSPTPTIANLS